MKILLLADKEDSLLWDYYKPGRLDGIDLMLSCGDLKASYLSFLVTMGHAPLYYIHGNHDTPYDQNPPEGCDCIEDQLVNYNGVRILGLGGSAVYSGGAHQYSEREMERRIRKLRYRIHRAGGVDILLTHAPAADWGDGEDYAHRGFEAFNALIESVHPRYHIHGHVHLNYGHDLPRVIERGDTTVINAWNHYELEI